MTIIYSIILFQFLQTESGSDFSLHAITSQVSDKLAPFLKLYETGVAWWERMDSWLSSPVGTHDPDVIAQDVAATWRAVYKLEKIFAEVPAAKTLVIAVTRREVLAVNITKMLVIVVTRRVV